MWIGKGRRAWLVPAIGAALCCGLAFVMFARTDDVDALIEGTKHKPGGTQQAAPWDPSQPYKLKYATWDLSVPPAQSGRVRRGSRPESGSSGPERGESCLEVGVIHK